jgi:5-methyltetrahydropteroyltriglutamate--homocysteine methyltransferase
MTILTEPIGSIPRPMELIQAIESFAAGTISHDGLDAAYEAAVMDTIRRFEETGSPIITDGEQRKSSFATYPLEGIENLARDGVVIPFADGHTRRLPRLTRGPFRYGKHTGTFVLEAKRHTSRPLKQAVISASALSLLYPAEGIADYSQEEFLSDLKREAEADIRSAFDAGAEVVQMDFTEARLSLKLDPSGGLLRNFVDLNNSVLSRFSAEEQKRIGVHVCPGGDHDSTHSADVSYSGLLPTLFELNAGRFYVQMASEPDRQQVLREIKRLLKPGQVIFIGVIDPIDPVAETPEKVKDRVLEAASLIPVDQMGTTDDCGFSPFADDTSTGRETAFAKIRSRVQGTAMAEKELGVS